MRKIAVALAALGVALLAISLVPWGSSEPAAALTQVALPTTVASATIAAPVEISDAAYGRALFSAKGCISCHRHGAIAGSGAFAGSDVPDLSTYRWNDDYLRAWLKDPSAIRPNTPMPNLELKQDEIEALIAFLKTK
jgi:cytochrome c2